MNEGIVYVLTNPTSTGLIALGGEAIFLGCYLGVLQIVLQTVLSLSWPKSLLCQQLSRVDRLCLEPLQQRQRSESNTSRE